MTKRRMIFQMELFNSGKTGRNLSIFLYILGIQINIF